MRWAEIRVTTISYRKGNCPRLCAHSAVSEHTRDTLSPHTYTHAHTHTHTHTHTGVPLKLAATPRTVKLISEPANNAIA